jgi:hypothetical protein
VLIFALFGCVTLAISTLAGSEDASGEASAGTVSWFVLGLSAWFAAALAARRSGGVDGRIAGVLLLVPAFVLHEAPDNSTEWVLAVTAWLLVLIGGLLASGLAQRTVGAVIGYFRGDDLPRSNQ